MSEDAPAKLPVRDRLALLLDAGSLVEDGRAGSGAGVVTGQGTVDGRPVIVIANDPAVPDVAGDMRIAEKIVRATEVALRGQLPVFWLLDAASARSLDQVPLVPGRRGAGRILHNQVALSGSVPQIACVFGPVADGGALVAGLADVLILVEGNAAIGQGEARMHCTVSGVGDLLARDDREAIELAGLCLSYLPAGARQPPAYIGEEPQAPLTDTTVPDDDSRPFDIHAVIDGLVDGGSLLELGELFAPEVVTGLARMDGRTVGIVANNCAAGGGLIGVDSAGKAARFVRRCDHASIPLIHLADVPGFADDSQAESAGIVRHAGDLLRAVCSATVPQLCVVVRRAYGAGLCAMCGPGLGSRATIALPTARIGAADPQAVITARYAESIDAIEDDFERVEFVQARRREHLRDTSPVQLTADLVVDAVVPPRGLREELLRRLAYAAA